MQSQMQTKVEVAFVHLTALWVLNMKISIQNLISSVKMLSKTSKYWKK